jgi:hypothetical protein
MPCPYTTHLPLSTRSSDHAHVPAKLKLRAGRGAEGRSRGRGGVASDSSCCASSMRSPKRAAAGRRVAVGSRPADAKLDLQEQAQRQTSRLAQLLDCHTSHHAVKIVLKVLPAGRGYCMILTGGASCWHVKDGRGIRAARWGHGHAKEAEASLQENRQGAFIPEAPA